MKKTKISVVVPVYNVKKFLKDCVESLVNQTFDDYEILLINDGSTDGSDKICEELSQKYKIVKTYNKKNGGLSDARNYGVLKSNGEYITFVDSDDYVHTQFLEKLYKGIEKGKTDISMCFYDKVPENAIITNCIINENTMIEEKEVDELFDILLTSNKSTPYETGTCKLIKKTILEKVKFPVGLLHEDTATTYKLFDNTNKISIINEKLYYYRQREGSITHVFNEKRLDLIGILNERQKYFDSKSKHLRYKHFTFMFNRFCRLRYESRFNKKSYKRVDIAINELLKNDTFKTSNINQKLKFYILGKCGFLTNVIIKLKDKNK